jgi:4-aminobutyrate aminotransferase-like enzyme/Ser/Thr protein kinase RdoA (MazF antagonist)
MIPASVPLKSGEAERIAREAYGLTGEARALPGEVDSNFLVQTREGKRFVLKVSPPGLDVTALRCQAEVLAYLADTPVARCVPRLIPTLDGNKLASANVDGKGDRAVRLVSFLPGAPLANVPERPDALLEDLGRVLGRLDTALRGFHHPGVYRRLAWDLTRTHELGELAHYIRDDGRRALVEARLERFREQVVPRLATLEHGVVHNDANDHNLLVGGAGGRQIIGVIDFGDMLHTVTVAEPAIACAYVMLDRDDPFQAAALVAAGYHRERSLTPGDQEVLFDLIVARLCASVLMSAEGRHRNPDNKYLRISERPVWKLLEKLNMMDGDEATGKLTASLGSGTEASGGCGSPQRGTPVRSAAELVAVRKQHLGRNLSISYSDPLKIVRGEGAHLYDDQGRRYVDLVNNVCHVGHCHPHVVAAAQRQMAQLNTNTRYLHDHLAEYALRLTATFPDPLSVCFFVCTGTEANDLALRLARTHTGSRRLVVLDHAYHGHSPSLVEISAYKCDGPGGAGMARHAYRVPTPDAYRGPFRGPDTGAQYAGLVAEAVETARAEGTPSFLAESLIGCGGQIIPPAGFLPKAHDAVRAAGGVCIADEVQVGFGRVGTHLWAFDALGATPDIVTLGKPIGNGHPMAAVITTPEIAASFDNGMEYFNTFGGNPVSCAVGLAVLDVIEQENLQQHAGEMGALLLEGLRKLQDRHEIVGDVRGLGLFLGVELVRDRETLEPADAEAGRIIDAMRDRGFLLSTDGPLHNVLKIKPPLVVGRDDLAAMLEALDEVLQQA